MSQLIEELLTAPEAARLKGVAESSVRRAIQTGRLPGIRKGRAYFIHRGDLDQWRPIGHRPQGSAVGPGDGRKSSVVAGNQEPGSEGAIRLLRSWRAGDKREQKETWNYLQKALDEDRLSNRKLFP